MKGTQKQTEWANNIITDWNLKLDNLIVDAKHRVNDNSMPSAWLDVTVKGVSRAKDMLIKASTASSIIDLSKKGSFVDRVNQLIINDYKDN